MLKAEGLEDVEMDGKGNVMGLRKGGTGPRPLIVITAHLTLSSRGDQCEGAARGRHALCAGHW
jgi:hypothetical protein